MSVIVKGFGEEYFLCYVYLNMCIKDPQKIKKSLALYIWPAAPKNIIFIAHEKKRDQKTFAGINQKFYWVLVSIIEGEYPENKRTVTSGAV